MGNRGTKISPGSMPDSWSDHYSRIHTEQTHAQRKTPLLKAPTYLQNTDREDDEVV